MVSFRAVPLTAFVVLALMGSSAQAAAIGGTTAATTIANLAANISKPLSSAEKLISSGNKQTSVYYQALDSVAIGIHTARVKMAPKAPIALKSSSTLQKAAGIMTDVAGAFSEQLSNSTDPFWRAHYVTLDYEMSRFLAVFDSAYATPLAKAAQSKDSSLVSVFKHMGAGLTYQFLANALGLSDAPTVTDTATGVTGCLDASGNSVTCVTNAAGQIVSGLTGTCLSDAQNIIPCVVNTSGLDGLISGVTGLLNCVDASGVSISCVTDGVNGIVGSAVTTIGNVVNTVQGVIQTSVGTVQNTAAGVATTAGNVVTGLTGSTGSSAVTVPGTTGSSAVTGITSGGTTTPAVTNGGTSSGSSGLVNTVTGGSTGTTTTTTPPKTGGGIIKI